MRKEKAGGLVSRGAKRALGNTSRDGPRGRWPGRADEERERCTDEEQEEERGKDLGGGRGRGHLRAHIHCLCVCHLRVTSNKQQIQTA